MITIVDYGAGNIGSIVNMIRKVGGNSFITSDPDDISRATKLILPGVGSFDFGMGKLRELELIEQLNHKAIEEKVPVLGICLGAQLMTKGSEEGELSGLGWFDAKTIKFKTSKFSKRLKVPHMGWNETRIYKQSDLLDSDTGDQDLHRYYYVHSYHFEVSSDNQILSTCNYGYDFVSGLEKENLAAVQFHPEKSHRFGMSLMKNFIEKF